jgi:hypothetical protein
MNVESLEQLRDALTHMDALVRHAVERAQLTGFDPNNTLRGLVITDEDAQFHLNRNPLEGLWDSTDKTPPFPPTLLKDNTPLGYLAHTFGLNKLDVAIILLCLAPELDVRYEKLYAYLQDDVALRRPTVNLLMNILGIDINGRFAVWERLTPHNPLREHRLLDCLPDNTRPNSTFLAHHTKLDKRIVAYLLGDEQLDERLFKSVTLAQPTQLTISNRRIHESIYVADAPLPLVYLHGHDHAAKTVAVESFCAAVGLPLLQINLQKLQALDDDFLVSWHIAMREAWLNGAVVLLHHWEVCLNENGEPLETMWQHITRLNRPVFMSGREIWEPRDTNRVQRLLRFAFDIPEYEVRRNAWETYLKRENIKIDATTLTELANKFRFTTDQIGKSVQSAIDLASSRNMPLLIDDLYQGAQAHAGLKLAQLASRITPRYSWHDLILPDEQIEQIQELVARANHANKVHDEWGFGEKGVPIRRVSALFAGESGTGKTLAAEVIAKQLGLVMYKIDLSSVVSKYIGETEKNLKTIFDEAQSGNAILFFDEADALLGKRSEVKDAHDRYANIEVAYLLQQIEVYDGVAIMATNLRQNVDEAFTRRLDFVIDFPFPDAEYRYHIWKAHFPSRAPLGADVNLHDVAERYRLAGGNIRNATLASAYLAATDGNVITMNHIRRAVRREHQKMGRLLDAVRD